MPTPNNPLQSIAWAFSYEDDAGRKTAIDLLHRRIGTIIADRMSEPTPITVRSIDYSWRKHEDASWIQATMYFSYLETGDADRP